jgi:hypothetical protein
VGVGLLILVGIVFLLRDEEPKVAGAHVSQEPLPPALPSAPAAAPPAPSAVATPSQAGKVGAKPDSGKGEAVTVTSEPSGAALVMDGAILGYTPVQFPRPDSGLRKLELRMDGYVPEAFLVSVTSPPELNLRLRRRVTVAPKPAAAAQAPAPRTEPKKRPRHQSEVVDPWE